MRRRAPAVLALLLAALSLWGCSEAGLGGDASVPVQPTLEREPAAPFSVAALEGSRQVDLASRRGRPVVVNFWASWCGPCRIETPDLIAFAEANPGIDVVGLAVNDRPDDSRRFAREFAIPYDLGIDRDGDVAISYGVTGLPATIVIDAEGRVADTFFGEITREQLDGYAAQLGL